MNLSYFARNKKCTVKISTFLFDQINNQSDKPSSFQNGGCSFALLCFVFVIFIVIFLVSLTNYWRLLYDWSRRPYLICIIPAVTQSKVPLILYPCFEIIHRTFD